MAGKEGKKEWTYNVAMHEPDARVVSLKGDNQMPGSWEHRNITTHGVGPVYRRARLVESAGALGENVEIMSVQMDRMSDTQCRLNNQIVHLVSRGKVQNVVVSGVAIAIEQLEQCGIGPVDNGTDAVERPLEDGSDLDANFDILRSGKVTLGDGLCDNGNEALERLVEAAVCHCAGGGGGVARCCRGAVAHNSLDVESHCVCSTTGGLNCSTEPVVINSGVGLDNDFVTLADTDAEVVRCEGSDRDKVSRDDCQAVAIE